MTWVTQSLSELVTIMSHLVLSIAFNVGLEKGTLCTQH